MISNCPSAFFDCGNGKCIAQFFVCDNDNDCGNFKDEMNCTSLDVVPVLKPKDCPENHFACHDLFDTCIPQRWVCDGLSECSNGADEQNCSSKLVDCGNDFKCENSQCISSLWRCDGIFDCNDNSDEKNCSSYKKVEFCDEEHGQYQCSTGECIPYDKVCDGHNDCKLGDDEGTQCHAKTCHDKKCSHLCLIDAKTNSSVCYCPPGYKLLNNTCIDYDECSDNKLTNLCSQRCINLEGSHKCDCFDGYRLDNNSCLANGQSPILYVSTEKEIRAYDLRKKILMPVVESQVEDTIVSLDMRVKDRKLLFCRYSKSHSSVYQVTVDSGNQLISESQLLFEQSNTQIEGISVDWLANNFYFTEAIANKIIICHIKTSGCATLIDNVLSPRGILAVPERAKLFWTQWDQHAHGVYQSQMDGSNVTLLFGDLEWPNDLAFDHEMNRLYWCDGKHGKIEYYDFDVKIRHVVFKDSLRQPFSLFVFEDNVYWSDWMYHELISCNKINCHHINHPLLQYNGHKRGFFGVTIFHPELQKSSRAHNPCNDSPCSHICAIRTVNSYTCLCPDHSELALNGKTCVPKSNKPYLLVSTGYKIYKYFPDSIYNNFEELNILSNYYISEMAFNFDRQELYIHDNYKNRIGAIDLHKVIFQQWTTLVDYDLNGVMGLVYDVNTDNIYWVDMIKGTIEVSSTKKEYHAILNADVLKPISLAISAESKTMFVGLRTSKSQIISLTMEGKYIRSILSSETGLPLAMVNYHSNELIWGDPIEQKIDFVLFNQHQSLTQPQKMIENHVDTVNSLAILNDDIYWTNADTMYVYSTTLNGTDKQFKRKHVQDTRFDNDVFRVVSASKQQPIYQYCIQDNPCAHICLIGETGPVCHCSQGFTSKDKGRTCDKAKSVTKFPVSNIFDVSKFFEFLTSKQKLNSPDSWTYTWPLKDDETEEKNNTIINEDELAVNDEVIPSVDSFTSSEARSSKTVIWTLFWFILIVLLIMILYKM